MGWSKTFEDNFEIIQNRLYMKGEVINTVQISIPKNHTVMQSDHKSSVVLTKRTK